MLRTVRFLEGGAIVAVRLRDRSDNEVLADLVEGTVAAHRLAGSVRGAELAAELRAALEDSSAEPLHS